MSCEFFWLFMQSLFICYVFDFLKRLFMIFYEFISLVCDFLRFLSFSLDFFSISWMIIHAFTVYLQFLWFSWMIIHDLFIILFVTFMIYSWFSSKSYLCFAISVICSLFVKYDFCDYMLLIILLSSIISAIFFLWIFSLIYTWFFLFTYIVLWFYTRLYSAIFLSLIVLFHNFEDLFFDLYTDFFFPSIVSS